MPKKYEKVNDLCCKVCEEILQNGKKLTNHINAKHKMSSEDYTAKYFYDGVKPTCELCGDPVRYVSFTFKRYCKEHSSHAESQAGRVGGKNKTQWNKGLTKAEDERIAHAASKISGENNPFWGKKHSDETIKRISSIRKNSHEEILNKFELHAPRAILLSSYEEYEDQNTLLRISCKDCGTECSVSLFNISRCWMCKTCHPLGRR